MRLALIVPLFLIFLMGVGNTSGMYRNCSNFAGGSYFPAFHKKGQNPYAEKNFGHFCEIYCWRYLGIISIMYRSQGTLSQVLRSNSVDL